MNINITLCERLSLICSKNKNKNSKSKSLLIENIIQDIHSLIDNPGFDNNFIFNHILNKAIQITNSEYAMMGWIAIEDQPSLNVNAFSNIAWNSSSFEFYKKYISQTMIKYSNFDHNFFGIVYRSQKPLRINKYAIHRNLLPSGHPAIKKCLLIPIMCAEKVVGIISLCNKLEDYSKTDIENIDTLTKFVSILYYEKCHA